MQRKPTDAVEKLFGGKGDPFILAPEVYQDRENGSGYSDKIDAFAAGCTLYKMLCGREPFFREEDIAHPTDQQK